MPAGHTRRSEERIARFAGAAAILVVAAALVGCTSESDAPASGDYDLAI